eukprot:CAMPEP_0184347066 /NCGR_PEP_ID=MMETSP1089-20130417/15226_1 /TAXON_ID=38269 ORGANISM="Gloeochaete wittrockiana, Strain SAG46.84" /NCGR_SAMPLE_ID=MMETSP1089 /ASSEMBLY_ACC=CAM_ASM_000445 /LENGTH=401 /DNA_ID=CAMNT_0026677981 /DNA_START=41 /DNA_END=1246 /DNA_ORIENTATION=+
MTTKIRASKFRHLFGTPFQLRDTYGDALVGSVSGESHVLKANKTFFALPWVKTGTVCVVPINRIGNIPEATPLFVYHDQESYATQINEIAFNPHDDFQLATAGNDGGIGVWRIPGPEGLSADITQPELRFQAGDKRLLGLDYHPLASNLVISVAGDKKVAFWDLEAGGAESLVLPDVHKGLLTNWSWNYDATLLSTACKDKKLRVFDPRASQVVAEVANHDNAKSAHVQWMGKVNKIFTAGFSKTSERELAVYDPRNLSGRLHTEKLSPSSSTVLMFGDEDTNLLFLGGKGDGTISYFDATEDAPGVHFLSEYKSKTPQNGLALLPKSVVNVGTCEIARFLKLSGNRVEPVRFEVPRAQSGSEIFHDDLYPDTYDEQPATTAAQWLGGANGARGYASMAPQ